MGVAGGPPRDPAISSAVLRYPFRSALLLQLAAAGCGEATARERPDEEPAGKVDGPLKEPGCCGYPIGEFKLTYYWLASEGEYAAEPREVAIFTQRGFLIGRFSRRFVDELTLEGSGILADGRPINYAGRCRYGAGVCFEILDPVRYPFGRGVKGRALSPYRSVAVDPRAISIGEPLYLPELDGVELPDGAIHDGCVRADDQGGAIRKREIDFFVASYQGFHDVANRLWWRMRVTPAIEEPHCGWLADER